SITGEHGVGFDKRELLSLIFSEADMDAMLRVRAAFDPTGLCNPGKIIPMLRGCGEARAIQSPMSEPVADRGRQREPLVVTGTAGVPPASSTGFTRGKVEILNPGYAAFKDTGRDAHGPSSSGARFHTGSPAFDPDAAKLQLASITDENNISALSSFPSSFIVSPNSIAEVCEVMKLATSEGWAVVPAGAMTWLDVGQPMKHVRLVISTRRMNRILEHEPADLIAVTEAGVTLDGFNRALAKKGQWLPLDPPNDGRTTIGGVVATGLGGPQQFGYGAPRRHVIGMKVVLADGTLIKVGGRVVKNVAGYDLCKLFTGSYGTLGTIVEVNFKLRPLPFATSSLLVAGEREELLRIARLIIHSRLFPVAVELLSPAMARAAELTEKRQHMLLLKFDGSSTAVLQQVARARELTSNCERSMTVAEDHHCWRRLAALPSQFEKNLVWRVGLSPADISTFVATLDEHSSGAELFTLMWQAGVGDGRIRVIEQLQKQGETDEIVRHAGKRLEQFRSEAERRGGTLTVEQATTELKTQVSPWGNFGSAAGIMDRIKQQLDPHAILSPGRFGFETTRIDPN
ncbi:MAG TPA: FAD-binding protein, partial [Pyrinomonadaceae bacterium]|nr:FAD-binding protein [Pyrinomonadaceae bacterium]